MSAYALTALTSIESAVPPNTKTKGFVITQLHLATYEGPTGRTPNWDKSDGRPECPDGLNVGVDTEAVLATFPKAEQEKLRRLPDNDFYKMLRMRQRGQFNMDVCESPWAAPDPGFKVVQGKIGFGFDLDTQYSCRHENFLSPTGEKGIDTEYSHFS